jgi:hypothetical protein
MRRSALLRVVTLTLAYAHTFPARKHLAAFVDAPSLSEGWKGLGALIAIGLYLLPPEVQARALVALWQRHKGVLRLATALLAAAHAVPALDHLPRFLEIGGWPDAWRGLGSTAAALWFVAPVPAQATLVSVLGRALRTTRSGQTLRTA